MVLKKIKGYQLLAALILGFMAITLLFPLSSCEKNGDCTAVITIVDSVKGLPLPNAAVTLTYLVPSTGKTNISNSQNTDGGGSTTFVIKLQAIYDVVVIYGGRKFTVGIIKLEPGQTVSQTYTFK